MGVFPGNEVGELKPGDRGEEYEPPPTLPFENWRENPLRGVVSAAAAAAAAAADMCLASSLLDFSCIAAFGHFILMTSDSSSTSAGRPCGTCDV